MQSLFVWAASLALVVPMMPSADAPVGTSAPQCNAAGLDEPDLANPLAAFRSTATAHQVRIEQRVVVRISPRTPAARQDLLAILPPRELAQRFEERGKEKCVALESIGAVQTGSGNRLVLFLRDRRMISINLEKSCRARDFYSGFYVVKDKDGRLCVDRDLLQSRTGAKCEVETMRKLVEVGG